MFLNPKKDEWHLLQGERLHRSLVTSVGHLWGHRQRIMLCPRDDR